MSRLTRDGTAELVSRDKTLRRERKQENINFPCLADHEQDWQPYPSLSILLLYVMTIHTYTNVDVDGGVPPVFQANYACAGVSISAYISPHLIHGRLRPHTLSVGNHHRIALQFMETPDCPVSVRAHGTA